MHFDIPLNKRLQQAAQARRKNLGLPEPDPKYKKYMREKPLTGILSTQMISRIKQVSSNTIIHVSRPRFPEYEYKWMSDEEYLLSCIKNEGWRLSIKW